MTEALERPKSRPRAIFLDLTSPVLPSCPVPEMPWPYKAERDAERYEDILCRLALETGLPIVAFVPDKDCFSEALEEAIEAQVVLVDQSPDPALCQTLRTRLGCAVPDILFISDPTRHESLAPGFRFCNVQDAIPVLHHLSHANRAVALTWGEYPEEEVAHTVLMPLDLRLGSMEDRHMLLTRGRLIFDVVLLLQDMEPTADFMLKTLEKLISGYAPIVHCLNDNTAPMQTEFPRAMRRLQGAGARKIVMVAADGGLEARTSEYRNIAETYGFECSFRTWNDLLASTRWPE